MEGLNDAKRALHNGSVVMCELRAFDDGDKIHHVRVTEIVRREGFYYGKSLGSGIWWPVVRITSVS